MKPNYNVVRSLIMFPIDYTVPQAIFLIEQYILHRTGKIVFIVVNAETDITKFERAITIADNHFRETHGKLWH